MDSPICLSFAFISYIHFILLGCLVLGRKAVVACNKRRAKKIILQRFAAALVLNLYFFEVFIYFFFIFLTTYIQFYVLVSFVSSQWKYEFKKSSVRFLSPLCLLRLSELFLVGAFLFLECIIFFNLIIYLPIIVKC